METIPPMFHGHWLAKEAGAAKGNAPPGIQGDSSKKKSGDVSRKPESLLSLVGKKPLAKALSYRPICLLDTMRNLLEEWIMQRLQSHMQGENSLSENQFGFRKGRSTVYVNQKYLIVQLHQKISFGEHLQIATAKAI